LTSIP